MFAKLLPWASAKGHCCKDSTGRDRLLEPLSIPMVHPQLTAKSLLQSWLHYCPPVRSNHHFGPVRSFFFLEFHYFVWCYNTPLSNSDEESVPLSLLVPPQRDCLALTVHSLRESLSKSHLVMGWQRWHYVKYSTTGTRGGRCLVTKWDSMQRSSHAPIPAAASNFCTLLCSECAPSSLLGHKPR